MTNIPTLREIQALDGKDFAMLSSEELYVLDFYRMQGRKFDVAVSLISNCVPEELASASSRQQADELMRRAVTTVSVSSGPRCVEAWAARASI